MQTGSAKWRPWVLHGKFMKKSVRWPVASQTLYLPFTCASSPWYGFQEMLWRSRDHQNRRRWYLWYFNHQYLSLPTFSQRKMKSFFKGLFGVTPLSPLGPRVTFISCQAERLADFLLLRRFDWRRLHLNLKQRKPDNKSCFNLEPGSHQFFIKPGLLQTYLYGEKKHKQNRISVNYYIKSGVNILATTL